MSIWVIGRKATIAASGHEYITEPFVAFRTRVEADAAAAMVKRISGEDVLVVEVPISAVEEPSHDTE